WLVLVVAFVSPLCALGSALFSARIVHHALMIAVAAPLLAMGGVRVWPWRSTGGLLSAATLVHGAAIWLLHAPAVYEAALSSSAVYWATEFVLLASALVFWQAVLDRGAPIGGAILALLATTMHMGLLGALLTFAGDPLYAPHAETTMAFGLSAIEDQQLGGLVMWIPAALPYLIGALTLTALALRSATGPAAARR
ncbi:MAG TPA: cytochrome c oxidase assembly protein, partial [Methylomirabilota bacterium]|nr:cytochrome c oxidase assembly protein [Methylomirabilota bacterium]